MLRNPPSAVNDVMAEDEFYDPEDPDSVMVVAPAPVLYDSMLKIGKDKEPTDHQDVGHLTPPAPPVPSAPAVPGQQAIPLPIAQVPTNSNPVGVTNTAPANVPINTVPSVPPYSAKLHKTLAKVQNATETFIPLEDREKVLSRVVKLTSDILTKVSENSLNKFVGVEDLITKSKELENLGEEEKVAEVGKRYDNLVEVLSDTIDIFYTTGNLNSKNKTSKNDQGLITSFPFVIPIDVESLTSNCGNDKFVEFIKDTENKLAPQISKLVKESFESKYKPLDASNVGRIIANKDTGYSFIIKSINGSDIEIKEVEFEEDGSMTQMDYTQNIQSHMLKDEFYFV